MFGSIIEDCVSRSCLAGVFITQHYPHSSKNEELSPQNSRKQQFGLLIILAGFSLSQYKLAF
jgi:hypothetical protein